MEVGRGRFGPALLAWADAAASRPLPVSAMERLATSQQVRRYAALSGPAAQSFIVGRSLLSELLAELSEIADPGFTTTCVHCGADHGRPRFDVAPVAVSVSYAGSMVAVAAVRLAEAAAVGVDIERIARAGVDEPLDDLAPLFDPSPPPDIAGWTLLEAALKADGRGVAADVAQVGIGGIGSGRIPGAVAVSIPGRVDRVDAAVLGGGPSGFVLSAALIPHATTVPHHRER